MSDTPADNKKEVPGRGAELARTLFLRDDNLYGCSESTYLTLKSVFGLADPEDSSAAMALNGGIAYSGSTCGAVTGAAMALGELASVREDDHFRAKKVARKLTIKLLSVFRKEFKDENCLSLIGLDISRQEDHDKFIDDGIWRTVCMAQIEFSVNFLEPLADPDVWAEWTKDF